jgi:hypothetical protein
MDANSREPWSDMDIADLEYSIAYGNTVAEAASFLCRDEDEVREKMKELGLVERPGSHCRQLASNSDLAASSVATRSSVRRLSGLLGKCNAQNHRRCSGPPRTS